MSSTALLRARAVLMEAGQVDVGTLERVAGTSNEVWRSSNVVVRIAISSTTRRLHSEALVLQLIDDEVPHAHVIAEGHNASGGWIVIERLQGIPLSERWASYTDDKRREVIRELARILRRLHDTSIQTSVWPLALPTSPTELADHPGDLSIPTLSSMCEFAAQLPNTDRQLLSDVRLALLERRRYFPADEPKSLVHGDFHFENVLADDSGVTSLIDFEWARLAPRDVDLALLLRFCARPLLHVGGKYETPKTSDYRDVPSWLRQDYPELFAAPNLKDRIVVHDLAYDLRDLIRNPPRRPMEKQHPLEPLNRMRHTLDGVASNAWIDLSDS